MTFFTRPGRPDYINWDVTVVIVVGNRWTWEEVTTRYGLGNNSQRVVDRRKMSSRKASTVSKKGFRFGFSGHKYTTTHLTDWNNKVTNGQ